MPSTDQESLIRDFTHLVIPAEIWLRKDISIQAKALWAELRSLHSKSKGGCFASDEYLMEFMGLRRSRLFEILKQLKEKNLVTIVGYIDGRTIRKANLEESRPDSKSGILDSQSGKPDCIIRDPGLTSIYIGKSDRKEENIAQSTSSLRSRDSLSFDHSEWKFTGITQKDLEYWKQLYPRVDLSRELLAMEQWLKANQSKSNKKRWRTFISGWLQRTQDKVENKAAYQSQKSDSIDRRTKNQDGTPIKPVYDNLF